MLPERIASLIQTERGRRITAIVATLLVEVLLLLALLTLGTSKEPEPIPVVEVTTFDVRDAAPPSAEPEAAPEQAAPRPSPLTPPPAVVESPPPAAVIPIRPTPAPPAAPSAITGPRPITAPPPGARAYGPAAPGRSADSRRVGTAPNGQPLYAAAWYRHPRDEEMRGYLSTATAGYATISCRTVPDFRVEDCTLENENPPGSGMGRAVLAMAWQFRVRPPMLGGQYQVGEWVRIRIVYDLRTDRFEY